MSGIARHKTAIVRAELSRPIKLAIGDGLITKDSHVFDYGCGLGDDLSKLEALGFSCAGWDPVHRPRDLLRPSRVVNIGYVVNVIESPEERVQALRNAWALTEGVLIVSARLRLEAKSGTIGHTYGDGVLTSRNTFQKYFDQLELRNLIDSSLSAASVPAAPGVFYVFRSDQDRAEFVSLRFRRCTVGRRLTKVATLFENHGDVLEPLLHFVGDRGRLPADDELDNTDRVREIFGSIKRAAQVLKKAADTSGWEQVAEQRTEDLLIFLALSRFSGRPKFSQLPIPLQRDVKSFFMNYKRACAIADKVLFSIAKPGLVEEVSQRSEIGKLTPTALYVHTSALDQLLPVLRLFEGCASSFVGQVEGANVIKLYRNEPKVSYLSYPKFEVDPHPALSFSLAVNLQTFDIRRRDYSASRNPPILHRKETFLSSDHPLYEKFARLTRIEEKKGLYEDTSSIGTREGWNHLLRRSDLALKGHRVVRLG